METQNVSMTDEDTTTVLVVDDEKDIAELYTAWLEIDHDVRTAYGGAEAVEKAEGVDIVFLDRQMPEYSGDEVLKELRDRGIDARVVMVTAVDPDFDIVDMPFDDYLTKPVMREDLDEAVERMTDRDTYDETLQEYFALSSKKATLETQKTPAELRESEEYQEMVERVEQLENEADAAVSGFDDDYDSLFQELPGGD